MKNSLELILVIVFVKKVSASNKLEAGHDNFKLKSKGNEVTGTILDKGFNSSLITRDQFSTKKEIKN